MFVRIKGLESPLLTRLGLPEASDFVTMNAAGAHSVLLRTLALVGECLQLDTVTNDIHYHV